MQIESMIIGAMLVILGVLASAVADRIRGIKATRRESSYTRGTDRAQSRARESVGSTRDLWVTEAHEQLRKDVIAALVQSGFKRPAAIEATDACKGAEQSTLESWIRAALKQAHSQAAA